MPQLQLQVQSGNASNDTGKDGRAEALADAGHDLIGQIETVLYRLKWQGSRADLSDLDMTAFSTAVEAFRVLRL